MKHKPSYTIPEILRLKSEGLTNSQIADQFDISSAMVWQLIKQEHHRLAAAERSATILAGIVAHHDLDKKLPVTDLLCVLHLSKRADRVLRRHFGQQGVTEFSLRNMMDFLIPAVDDAKEANRSGDQVDFEDYYRHMPAYRVKMLGQILYAEMIKAMSALECGEVFRSEWTERKRRLRDYLIGSDSYNSYFLRGKHAALRS